MNKYITISIAVVLAAVSMGIVRAASLADLNAPAALAKAGDYTGAIAAYNAIIVDTTTMVAATNASLGIQLKSSAQQGVLKCLENAGSFTAAAALIPTMVNINADQQQIAFGDLALLQGQTNVAITAYSTGGGVKQAYDLYISNRDTVNAASVVLNRLQVILKGGPITVFDSAQMRQLRVLLNNAATIQNKVMMRKNGQSFVGPNSLTLAIALANAENTGTGFKAALTALGFSVPSGYDTEVANTQQQLADVLSGWVDPTASFYARLEYYLGCDAIPPFMAAYNGTAKLKVNIAAPQVASPKIDTSKGK